MKKMLVLLAAALALMGSMLGHALAQPSSVSAAPLTVADTLYLDSLDAAGIYYSTPQAAINLGVMIAVDLTNYPTLQEFYAWGDVIVLSNKGIPGQYQYSYSDAGKIIHIAVLAYAPAWVEARLSYLIDQAQQGRVA